jgi:membrane-bound serine protease (ClpP class)
LLITIGAAGLLAEVWNPGTWIPGFIGVVSLLLGLYGLGQLDANLVGLALMVLGVALFIAEAFTPAFGALLVGGMIAFGLGVALLFDEPGLEVPWSGIALLAAALGGFIFFASLKGLAVQRRRSIAGGEGLTGQIGRVGKPFDAGETGSVYVNGEWWSAELDAGAAHSGDHVQVVGRRGFTLLVQPSAQERENHGTTR